jgi:hypothetical protein
VGIDFWGDAAQVCVAVGGLLGGVATVGVAVFGARLWKATGELGAYTRSLADQTEELARQTSAANQDAAVLAEQSQYAALRPRFSVMIVHDGGDYAHLYVRHLPESPGEIVDELSARIRDAFDRGDGEGARAIRGPWRFKAGADDAERRYGRTVSPRANLHRGAQTRWALSRQTDDIGRELPPWPADPDNLDLTDPCLIDLVASAGERTWSYSVLVTEPGTEFRL